MRWVTGIRQQISLPIAILAILIASSNAIAAPKSPAAGSDFLRWDNLPSVPDKIGLAGAMAGVTTDDALVVAGGANFPDMPPWLGGTKVWHDRVFLLRGPDASWKILQDRLPRPLAYSVSLTTALGIAVIGGSNSERHYADCFLLRVDRDKLTTTTLPSLPRPIANASGALLGKTIYVAGGIEQPAALECMNEFWSLDLSDQEGDWLELEPWPGPGRMFAVAGVQNDSFFLFSGTALRPGPDGKPVREALQDAYRFTPSKGWVRVADLPRPAIAAPSPAPSLGQSHLLVLGGNDSSQVDVKPAEHTGFSRDVLSYNTITDTWVSLDRLPFSLVTTPAVIRGDRITIPGGEKQPGIRSNEVWMGRAVPHKTGFGWLDYTTLAIYLLGMVVIGWVCAARNKSTQDYFKASGRIPWWAAGLSIYATMLSSLTFMAIPAKAYSTDWTFFWSNVPILLLAPLIVTYYLPFFRQLNVTSAYEYLEKRFNLAARLYASAAFILFQLGRQAIVLLLPSLALATVSDLNVNTCVILMGTLCVAYTAMGGIEAVIWTDVAQTVVLLGAAILSLTLIVMTVPGGIGGFWSTAMSASKLHMFNWTLDPSNSANAFWVIFLGSLFINLVPYTSDQTVVQRYMTTHDEAGAARAIWLNGLLAIPSTALFFAIGTALFVFYHSSPEKLDPTQGTDSIFPAFIVQNMPAGVAGLVIAGIFAASQSTVSSSLNSVATVVMTDFYGRFGGRVNDDRGLRIARLLTVANGLFATGAALLLAKLNLESLWDAYLNLVGLAGSGLAGLFALGIFTRRAHGTGAMVGAAASAGILYWVQQHSTIHFLLYACIGFLTCTVIGWVVSALLPSTEKTMDGLTIYGRAR
jgi:solute:Na+ symporter, SSS family